MKRQNFPPKYLTILATLALMPMFGSNGDAAQRNIVLYVADDHGLDAGAYGNGVIETPHMDQLAAEGTRFDYAFATTASCSASRSVILSGLHNHANAQYGHTHAYNHFRTYEDVSTLPVLIAEHAGYRTLRIGKYHVAPEDVYFFEHALPGPNRNPVQMAENVGRFLAEDDNDRPFFLLFATSDPHRGGGTVDDSEHRPDRFGNREQGFTGIERVRTNPEDVIVPDYLPDTPAARAELAEYYESVNRVDQGLGRLIEVLKEAGVYDETLIIYTSDHGAAFAGAKTTVYEPGLHVPFIVRNPYAENAVARTDAMISFVDITPTLLDFAGTDLPVSVSFHGRSFLPVIDQENPEGWDTVHASHTFHEITMYYPMRVVRDRRYKLIWNLAHELTYPSASDLWASPTFQRQYEQGPSAPYGQRTIAEYMHRAEFELYDLENDPHEARNLAGDPASQDLLQEMQQRLRDFQEETEDPWILKWEYE